jgi:predicted phage tail protein
MADYLREARITPVTLSWNKVYDGEDQYLNWLGAIADHDITSISDILINGNPISFYEDVKVETRLGTVNQSPVSFFKETISEKTVNMRLSTEYVTARTDGNTCQGLGFILCFTQGLAYISDSGSYAETSVTINMQYRKVGDEDWTDWKTETIKDSTGSALYKLYRAENISDAGAQYDLRAKFVTAPTNATRYRNMCYFVGVQEIVYDEFSYPGRSLLGIRLKANDLINSSTSLTVTCVAERTTVQVYNGSSWVSKDASNPAWASWDLLHNENYGGCVPTKRIIYSDFEEWASWLETQPLYRVNGVIDTVSTLQEWLQQIAMLGRGAVVQIGSKFTCLVDRPVATPVAKFLFNVGNIRKNSFSEKFLSTDERANCIDVTFKDKDSDYSEQTLPGMGRTTTLPPIQAKTTSVNLFSATMLNKPYAMQSIAKEIDT